MERAWRLDGASGRRTAPGSDRATVGVCAANGAAFRLDEDPPTYQDHHIGFRIVSDD